jgi:hypothetical protein
MGNRRYFGSEGRVYFDNIVLVDLGRLNMNSCPPDGQGSSLRCEPPLTSNKAPLVR